MVVVAASTPSLALLVFSLIVAIYLLAPFVIFNYIPSHPFLHERSDSSTTTRLRVEERPLASEHISPSDHLSLRTAAMTMTNQSLPRNPLNSADIALCLIVKDDVDLEEWVQYHVNLGVRKIYVFDNNSTHPLLLPVLHPFIANGHVEYQYLSDPIPPAALQGLPNQQLYAYQRCIREFGERHEFMGFIDSDEFIVVKNRSSTLLDILAEFRDYGGLTLNWMIFGSSGHVTRPNGGVLKNYFKCRPDHHLKSIVNLKFVRDVSGDPHHFKYKDGYFAVDTNFTAVPGSHNPGLTSPIPSYLYEKLYLNHYFTKSKEDFLNKVRRGQADSKTPRSKDVIDRVDAQCAGTCEILQMPTPTIR